jgi:hypothetical protein
MIVDFSSIILSYSSEYTKSSNTTFTYGGITYDNTSNTSTIHGLMTPLEDADIELLSNLGYIVEGKKSFFVPGTETLLTEDDIITDSNGIEWIILPKDKNGQGIQDWREHGNFIKYIVSRRSI